ncbi:transglutaminase-like cysteine peptidase [Mesorhizobium sp. Z1-4]|uniref:transglutaminase-like cysteine peptidase n=1 Tax=Mesorhizobium sp. Z1-4 TaxID=2448478 RepID=UPI000FDCB4E3|nr:transglutaminase-like cysteine peptidase [Mesorhizobium sp. Z1-4]
MGHKIKILLSAAALALAPQIASANSFMVSTGRTTQPVGHYEFCQQVPVECRQVTQARQPVELTRKLWAKIVDVNNLVNTMVAPRTDREIWGVEERWSYPTKGIGDCEDYVLEKRRLLMKAGIPAGNLMITVVRQPNGDGHAVLTARTSLGDFVLDNLEPRVLAWTDTEYRYLKRQSDQNSGVWVSIEDARQVAVGSVRSN